MKNLLLYFSALLLSISTVAQNVDHWEALVLDNVDWRYKVPVSEPDPNWNTLSFDDSSWSTGMGGIGYGDNDDSTIVASGPVYMRHVFNVIDPNVWPILRFAMDFDDGYVAYLNGVEISRRNLGVQGSNVPFNTNATAQHEAVLYLNGVPENDTVPSSLLQQGLNVLAIQTHNQSPNSSDLSARPFLFGATTLPSGGFGTIPTWFVPPLILATHLPLIILNTEGQVIVDDPRIVVRMGIVDNGPGQMNHFGDAHNAYDGLVNIEVRGSSSQSFPKKQYGFETQDSVGNSLDVSLLGMPTENDWILHAPYSDKSLMRNFLTYNWWRQMGWYTTRTKFCEVILNGDYQGIYILMEQIKWDNDRVDIEKIDGDDNAGDSLTGGYIFKVDKTTGSGQYDWASHVDMFQGQPKTIQYQYDYPNRDTITVEQQSYLQQFVHDWEQALLDSTFAQPDSGYRKYVDVNSFIDYFIIEEVTKNVDGYRLSTYLNKQRDSRGGKLQAGPAWDFNITLGNADYCAGGETTGFALDFPCDQSVIPFWWHRMNQDSVYWNQVQCRWSALRQGLLSDFSVDSVIDANVNLLGDAVQRNFERWPILNEYVWPNNYVGGSYASEIEYLKQWIHTRFLWLDENIGQPVSDCISFVSPLVTISEINYNSVDTIDTEDWFEMKNLTSDTIDLSYWSLHDGNEFNTFRFPVGTHLLPDSFLVVSRDTAKFLEINSEVSNMTGPFNWGIGNGGDVISLRDAWNNPVLSMGFSDASPWPNAPDGNGQTLEKWDWATDLNDPQSWHEGCLGGSPGRSFEPCVYAGVKEVSTKELRVYPNPATNEVFVSTQVSGKLELLSIAGKSILTESKSKGTFRVDVSKLPAGFYVLKFASASGLSAVKVIVR